MPCSAKSMPQNRRPYMYLLVLSGSGSLSYSTQKVSIMIIIWLAFSMQAFHEIRFIVAVLLKSVGSLYGSKCLLAKSPLMRLRFSFIWSRKLTFRNLCDSPLDTLSLWSIGIFDHIHGYHQHDMDLHESLQNVVSCWRRWVGFNQFRVVACVVSAREPPSTNAVSFRASHYLVLRSFFFAHIVYTSGEYLKKWHYNRCYCKANFSLRHNCLLLFCF